MTTVHAKQPSIQRISEERCTLCLTLQLIFRYVLDTFKRSFDLEQQMKRMYRFSEMTLTFSGRVKLRKADVEICTMEDAFPLNGIGNKEAEEGPRQLLLGRKVAKGCGFYCF